MIKIRWLVCFVLLYLNTFSQVNSPSFRVIAFYTGTNDAAHISFVQEAIRWFGKQAQQKQFIFDSTSDWNQCNDSFLARYQVVMFLDSRPDSLVHRQIFQKYMEDGGGWMGFHFAGFALTPSAYPQNWDWYHNNFLGAGQYKSNTWRPTAAMLRVENKHPSTRHLKHKFLSAPSEWYRWEYDLRNNRDIKILLAIDSSSFPLGTGPKEHEIWHSGYYPVAWTNTRYRMIYLNMGHNDIDYENKTNRTLSSTFESSNQNTFIIDALMWLGTSINSRKNSRHHK
ncbi:MAG TPA: ThuA domain-containing protein [Flavitalea sp.]|nr:ThuA domain-containing protein [Flavitalea sp.]